MLKAKYEPRDLSRFAKDHAMAEKLQETKRFRGMEVELGVNAYFGTPRRIWFTVGVGAGYSIRFGTDYQRAKEFYDKIDWFLDLLADGQEIRNTSVDSERKIWRRIAKTAGGEEIQLPSHNAYYVNLSDE
jgi:hypothetical protein